LQEVGVETVKAETAEEQAEQGEEVKE